MLLLLTIAVTVVLTLKNLSNDNLQRLLGPISGVGDFCDIGKLKGYPYLYYTDLSSTSLSSIQKSGVCVKECPSLANNLNYQCNEPNCDNAIILQNLYPTTAALNSYCFPTDRDSMPFSFRQGYDTLIKMGQPGQQLINDFHLSRRAIWTTMAVAIVLNLIYIYLMANFTSVLALISLVLIEVCMVASVGGFVYLGFSQRNPGFYVGAGIMALFVLIFNCILCANWTNFKVAVAVIDATADFFVATKRLVILSLIFVVVTFTTIAYFGGSMLIQVSSNQIVTGYYGPGSREVIFSNNSKIGITFTAVVMLWTLLYLKEHTQFIVSYSASSYYFNSTKSNEGSADVMVGCKIASFKHCGSIALAGLLHTVVTILRVIVESFARQNSRGGNIVGAIIACVAVCLVRLLEDIVQYMNKVALAYMAITGESYCKSAWNGFLLNLKHLGKFYYAQMLGRYFMLIGFLAIMAINSGVFYLILKSSGVYYQMNSIAVSMIANVFMTMFITRLFLGMFDDAVLGMLMSLGVDTDIHGGECQHGPPGFHRKLEKIFHAEKTVGIHGYY